MSKQDFDPSAFRQALGSFATGVTIITTRTEDGEPLGLTVNSFNSVSLNPPMVLWSLAETYKGYEAFKKASHWAVHVLATDQEDLSNRFAGKADDKFSGLEFDDGINGNPLLKGCAARFECKTAFQYEGGDHLIFVGEVESFDQCDSAPLVFHSGRYAHATPRDANDPRHAFLSGSFDENFLGYLLGRSHYRFYSQIKPHLEDAHLSDEEFYLLSTLTLKKTMTALELDTAMSGILNSSSATAIQSLISRGLAHPEHIDQSEERPPLLAYELTAEGRKLALKLISAGKVVESQVNERLGYEDSTVLRSLLVRLLEAIDPDASHLWENEDS
ncbi:MAG: flavin reductase [Oceanococcus sp.]